MIFFARAITQVFKSRAIMGHWYLVVSMNFHEHSRNLIMVLRKGYSLDFVPSDVRKRFQGMDHLRRYVGELGR